MIRRCVLGLAALALGGCNTEPVLEPPGDEPGPEAVVADGVFWVKRCEPEAMSPGYTLVYPLEGHTVYWLRECEVARTMDMPGRVGMVRQDDRGIYGLVGSSILGFDADGTRRFAVYREQLPGSAHHDVIATGRDTYLSLTKVRVGDDAFDDVIVEVSVTGEVLWSWSVNEHLLGSPTGTIGLPGEQWVHSNSLDIYPNGDILLSARNLDLLVRITYPSGDIAWKTGDDVLSKQHHANVWPNGRAVVFDNGVRRGESGIVLFNPDGSLELDRRLGFYSEAFGSVEQLGNGNWLVVDGRGGRVLEYTPDLTRLVFELKLLRGNYIPYASDPEDPVKAFLYRAHRVPHLPRVPVADSVQRRAP